MVVVSAACSGAPSPAAVPGVLQFNFTTTSHFPLSSKSNHRIPDDVASNIPIKRRTPWMPHPGENVARNLSVFMEQVNTDPPTIRVTVTNDNTGPISVYTPSTPLDRSDNLLDFLYPSDIKKADSPLHKSRFTSLTDHLDQLSRILVELDSGESIYRDINLDIVLSKAGDWERQHRDGVGMGSSMGQHVPRES